MCQHAANSRETDGDARMQAILGTLYLMWLRSLLRELSIVSPNFPDDIAVGFGLQGRAILGTLYLTWLRSLLRELSIVSPNFLLMLTLHESGPSETHPPPTFAVHPPKAYRCAAIQASVRLSSKSSGSTPPLSISSWKVRISNLAPSAFFARSRSSRNFSWPSL